MNITILVMNFNDIDVTFPEFIYTVLYILVFILLSSPILMKLGRTIEKMSAEKLQSY